MSTLRRMRSPVFTSLNCPRETISDPLSRSAKRREGRGAHRELPGAVQALDLVHPLAHVVELLVEALFLDHLPRGVQQQKRIRGHVVVDLRAWPSVLVLHERGYGSARLTSIAMILARSKSVGV